MRDSEVSKVVVKFNPTVKLQGDYELTHRQISHVLLLHYNLAAALFLGELIQYFKDIGWEGIDADKAYKDDFYSQESLNIPAGESLVWALAKESGRFDKVLRYPAEDGEYEKILMDKLGLWKVTKKKKIISYNGRFKRAGRA